MKALSSCGYCPLHTSRVCSGIFFPRVFYPTISANVKSSRREPAVFLILIRMRRIHLVVQVNTAWFRRFEFVIATARRELAGFADIERALVVGWVNRFDGIRRRIGFKFRVGVLFAEGAFRFVVVCHCSASLLLSSGHPNSPKRRVRKRKSLSGSWGAIPALRAAIWTCWLAVAIPSMLGRSRP